MSLLLTRTARPASFAVCAAGRSRPGIERDRPQVSAVSADPLAVPHLVARTQVLGAQDRLATAGHGDAEHDSTNDQADHDGQHDAESSSDRPNPYMGFPCSSNTSVYALQAGRSHPCGSQASRPTDT